MNANNSPIMKIKYKISFSETPNLSVVGLLDHCSVQGTVHVCLGACRWFGSGGPGIDLAW
jgi:hypothetical protein